MKYQVVKIKEEIYSKIEEYCKANSIEDIESFINKLINRGYMGYVYGSRPGDWNKEVSLADIGVMSEDMVNKFVDDVNAIYKADTPIEQKIDPNTAETNVQDVEHYKNDGVELVIPEKPKKGGRKRVLR